MARSIDESAPERAYAAIKRDLMAGALRFNERLDPGVVASTLGVSATPVREALIRLRVERLVAFKPAHGYFVSLWSEAGLRSLYLWRGALAALAFGDANGALVQLSQDNDYVSRVRAVLGPNCDRGNPELIAAAANADDRLSRARRAELGLWPKVMSEVDGLAAALHRGPKAKALRALRRYHERRAEHAAAIRGRAVLLDLPSNGG